jgi:diguanylate cyclase (GGDEF)-like protein
MTVSIGVATYPAQAAGVESLIAAADGALYHAKRLGRDRVVRADWSHNAPPAALRA